MNIIHSIDGWVLRSLVRRCNYDLAQVKWASSAITEELLSRSVGLSKQDTVWLQDDETLSYYVKQYERSGIADIVILPHLYADTVVTLSTEHLKQLNRIIETMLEHKPFPIVTVHDDSIVGSVI